MLQLSLHDFYSTVVKTKYKLHIASGSAHTPPQQKILGARLEEAIQAKAHFPHITLLSSL